MNIMSIRIIKIICGALFVYLTFFSTAYSLDYYASTESDVKNSIRFRTLASISGNCKRFVVGNKRHDCSQIIYSDFDNKRIAFNFFTGNGSIMLSGDQDSRLDSTSYKLLIDRIRYSNGDINTNYDASGYCEVISSKDQYYIRTITCRASNGVEKIFVDFNGDGTPVQDLLNP